MSKKTDMRFVSNVTPEGLSVCADEVIKETFSGDDPGK